MLFAEAFVTSFPSLLPLYIRISQVVCFHADKTLPFAYGNESSLTSPAGAATVAVVEAAGGGRPRRNIGDAVELHLLSPIYNFITLLVYASLIFFPNLSVCANIHGCSFSFVCKHFYGLSFHDLIFPDIQVQGLTFQNILQALSHGCLINLLL